MLIVNEGLKEGKNVSLKTLLNIRYTHHHWVSLLLLDTLSFGTRIYLHSSTLSLIYHHY